MSRIDIREGSIEGYFEIIFAEGGQKLTIEGKYGVCIECCYDGSNEEFTGETAEVKLEDIPNLIKALEKAMELMRVGNE